MTHICISKLTIIGSGNGLSPDRRQAIIWTNAGILLIGPLGTNFSEILIKILTFSFNKMRLKVSSAKRRPFCLGLSVLMAPFHTALSILDTVGLFTSALWYRLSGNICRKILSMQKQWKQYSSNSKDSHSRFTIDLLTAVRLNDLLLWVKLRSIYVIAQQSWCTWNVILLGWCAVWLKSNCSPKLNFNKEELSHT